MPRRLTNLINTYQDMRDRYGLEDPIVVQLKQELERCETAESELPFGERRQHKLGSRFWNRQPRNYGSTAGRR
jgi:hypothetical protein